jgi:hypothetical protein
LQTQTTHHTCNFFQIQIHSLSILSWHLSPPYLLRGT